MLTRKGILSGCGIFHKTRQTGNQQNRGIWDHIKPVFQKRPSRAPQSADILHQGESLMHRLDAEARSGVFARIELTNVDLLNKLGLPKNFLGIKRSVEYRAILDLLNRYHKISLNTDPQSRPQETTILNDLITTCELYKKVKNRRLDREKMIDQVLDQAQKALASIIVTPSDQDKSSDLADAIEDRVEAGLVRPAEEPDDESSNTLRRIEAPSLSPPPPREVSNQLGTEVSTQPEVPEASTEAQHNLPWFASEGSLGAGYVDTSSEEFTADHLSRVYSELAYSAFSGELCREVRNHLQEKLRVSAGQPEPDNMAQDQADLWEFLLRNGTSFYSKHEKATVRIDFKLGEFQHVKQLKEKTDEQESRTRYCDTVSGSDVARLRETKRELGPSMYALVPISGAAAAAAGTINISMSKKKALKHGAHIQVQSDCKPIAAQMQMFCGHVKMVMHIDGGKPRRFELPIPNQLRLQIPKGTCEEPASPNAPEINVLRPEALYTVSHAVHSFPIKRLIDGLRAHLVELGISPKATEKLLNDARKDFFNEKNFIARSQYLFTASMVSHYFKVKTGVSSQFETFFQAGAELDKVQFVDILPKDGSSMNIIRDDIGEGVLLKQTEEKGDGIDLSLGISANTPKFGPNIRAAAGATFTLFGTKKTYSQKVNTRSLAKEAVISTDSLCRYKAETNVTVKIHSNVKQNVSLFQCRIPIEILIPKAQVHDFERHALGMQNPAGIDNPVQIQLSSSQVEGSYAKAIQDCLHFGYSKQMPGSEKILQTIQNVLREDGFLNKIDVRRQSNIIKALQLKFSVPALRARHQNLLQGCRIVHEFPVGHHHYRIELEAHYRLADSFRKMTGMSAYRYNRSILETGNAESKSKYWGFDLKAFVLESFDKKNVVIVPGGGVKYNMSRSRTQEHEVASGNWEHRCLKTGSDVLRLDCPAQYMLTIDVNDARGKPAKNRNPWDIDGETSFILPIELLPQLEQVKDYQSRTTALQKSSKQEFNAQQDELKLSDHGIDSTIIATYGTAELATVVSRLVKQHTIYGPDQTDQISDIKIPEEISNTITPGYLQSKIGNLIGPSGVVIPLATIGAYERSVTLRVKTYTPTYMGTITSNSLGIEQYSESYANFSNTKTRSVSHSIRGDLNLGVKLTKLGDGAVEIREQHAGQARSYAKNKYTDIGLDANLEHGRGKDNSHATKLGSMNLSMAIKQGPFQRFCADTIYEIAFHIFRPETSTSFGGIIPPEHEEFVEYCKIKHGLELLMPNPLALKYNLPPTGSALNLDAHVQPDSERGYIQPELALHCSHLEHLDAEQVLPKITELLQQRILENGIHPEIAAGNAPVIPKRILDESFSSDALRLSFGQLRSTGIYKQVFYPKGGKKSLKIIGVRVTASLGRAKYCRPHDDIGISVGAKSFEVSENSEAKMSSCSGALGLSGGVNIFRGTFFGVAGQAGLESSDKIEHRTKATFRNQRRLDVKKAEEFSHTVEYRIELWDEDTKSEKTRRMQKIGRTIIPRSPAPGEPKEPFASATVQGSLRILVPADLIRARDGLSDRQTEPVVTGRIVQESVSPTLEEQDPNHRRILSKNLHALNFPGASMVARWAAAAFSQAPSVREQDPTENVPSLPSRFELPKIDGAKLNQAFNVENLRSNIGLLLNHQYIIDLQGEDKLTVGLEVTKVRWLTRAKVKSRNQARQVREPETKTEQTRRKFISTNWHGGALFDVMTPYLEGDSAHANEVSEAQSSVDKDLDEKVLAYNRSYEFGEMDIRFHVHGSNGQCVLIDVANGMTAAIMSDIAGNLKIGPEAAEQSLHKLDPIPEAHNDEPEQSADKTGQAVNGRLSQTGRFEEGHQKPTLQLLLDKEKDDADLPHSNQHRQVDGSEQAPPNETHPNRGLLLDLTKPIPCDNLRNFLSPQHGEIIPISGRDMNCFPRMIATYFAKRAIQKPNGDTFKESEIESVVAELAGMLEKHFDRTNQFLDMNDMYDPWSIAVKRYFDRKFKVDIAVDIFWLQSGGHIGEYCSDAAAKDVVFGIVENPDTPSGHYSLFVPNHAWYENWQWRHDSPSAMTVQERASQAWEKSLQELPQEQTQEQPIDKTTKERLLEFDKALSHLDQDRERP